MNVSLSRVLCLCLFVYTYLVPRYLSLLLMKQGIRPAFTTAFSQETAGTAHLSRQAAAGVKKAVWHVMYCTVQSSPDYNK